jgi:hypothetical protein
MVDDPVILILRANARVTLESGVGAAVTPLPSETAITSRDKRDLAGYIAEIQMSTM